MTARLLALALACFAPGHGAQADEAPAAGPAPAGATLAGPQVQLTLRVRDPLGRPLEARVRLQSAAGAPFPAWTDSALLSHGLGGTYFYVDSAATLAVTPGTLQLTVGRGFETTPWTGWIGVLSDTTVEVTLQPFTDLAALGWYAGEMHSHSAHPPMDYPALSPALARRVQRAEAISVLHVLDQDRFFTGGPHPLSEPASVLYYSYESRNQTWGHVELPGLLAPSYPVCCLDPAPAWPMLTDLHRSLAGSGALMILAHPHTTDNFMFDTDWPGAGLGRELPVLAATGEMDALDVMSASNEPDADWSEWYDLLSSGLAIAPSAGSDAVLNRYYAPPPGGFRVYARLEPGEPFSYDEWLESVRAGRTFITSYPLVPEFSVADRVPGQTLEAAGDSLEAPVHLRAECAIGLTRVAIVADGAEAWSRPFTGSSLPTAYDTTLTLSLPTPAWMALHVLGPVFHPHAPFYPAEAHTNAIRLLRDGRPVRRTLSCAIELDLLTRLESYVLWRGGAAPWQTDSIMARIERARAFYRSAFVEPPAPFQLLVPAFGDTATAGFLWEANGDPEPGDRVRYVFRVGEDSTFAGAWVDSSGFNFRSDPGLAPDRWYWWQVEALDRAGNVRIGGPSRFYLGSDVTAVEGAAEGGPPRAVPNPSRGAVALAGFAEAPAIFDLAGRRVAGLGSGLCRAGAGWRWDGGDGGRPARPGVYLVRSADGRRCLRVVRIR